MGYIIRKNLCDGVLTAEHIKSVKKRLKTSTPKLELEHQDAGGLLGELKEKS